MRAGLAHVLLELAPRHVWQVSNADMTLFERRVQTAITRVLGIEVMDKVWPACYALLRETQGAILNIWAMRGSNQHQLLEMVIKMARPSHKYDVTCGAFKRAWPRVHVPDRHAMLRCLQKLNAGGCKELKEILSLSFYRVPSRPQQPGYAVRNIRNRSDS